LLYAPAARWADADAILARIDGPSLSATSSLLWRPTMGALALRRGDLETADALLTGVAAAAIESGEAQRIIPMACAVLPWLHVSARPDELRAAGREILATVGDQWPSVISVDAIARTFAAAGERELLAALIASLERADRGTYAGRRRISLLAAKGLDAFVRGDAAEAIPQLSAAIAREDALGFAYDSSRLRLDLAQAYELAGDLTAAETELQEAEAVLVAIACINPV
jgi:hypothetical protein